MTLHITARHVDLNPELRAYLEDRIDRLRHFLDPDAESNVILSSEKHRFHAEVTMRSRRHSWVGAFEAADLRAAFDEAVSRIEVQLKKHKDRITDRKKRTHLGEAMAQDGDGTPDGVEIEDEE